MTFKHIEMILKIRNIHKYIPLKQFFQKFIKTKIYEFIQNSENSFQFLFIKTYSFYFDKLIFALNKIFFKYFKLKTQ